MKTIRKPAVAGMFYPASAEKLRYDIQQLLDANRPEQSFENIFGIVSPHAGYVYSGKTAAFAFNTIADKHFKTVIIISPSHREYFPGISIYNGDEYETPLGKVPLDKKMISQLTDDEIFIFEGLNGHSSEHAVEVQIPFLQTVLKDFLIVPVVIGDQRKLFVDGLAKKLAEVVNEETLIVASSDLSHFHTQTEAGGLDSIVINRVKNFDYDGLQKDLETNKCEACGGGGIVALLKAAALLGKNKSAILSHTDSGEVTGDSSEVVGYLSAVVYG